MRKSPCQGGCWFCYEDDDRPMHFSMEFDTYFHMACLKAAIDGPADSVNEEVEIMAREFDIPTPASYKADAHAWDAQFWGAMCGLGGVLFGVYILVKLVLAFAESFHG